MEEINKLIGIHQDNIPAEQPENTARYAKNFVIQSEDGDFNSLSNESGTELKIDSTTVPGFPSGFKIMGHSILNTDIIVILVNNVGVSQVGVINSYGDMTYTLIGPVDVDGNPLSNNNELGFSIDYPIDCISRKLINGDRILYFTDNNVPFGVFNLDNPPTEGTVSEEVKLIFDQKLPNINLVGVTDDSSGSLKAGTYQFITRYITDNGNETTFGIPCNPIPVVTASKSDGVNSYEGGYPTTTANKSIELSIENVDTKFSELEIFAIYYEGLEASFVGERVARIPIGSETINYTYNGLSNESNFRISYSELTKTPVSYTHAKCIEQKDNTLFLSNLSNKTLIEVDLQAIANDISVSYEIEELPFCQRGSNNNSRVDLFYLLSNPVASGEKEVTIEFTSNPDSSSGSNLNNYLLHKNGNRAEGSIEVTDSFLINDGDTITINSSPSITVTARTSPTNSSEYQIVPGDNNTTADNILDAIVAQSTEFFSEITTPPKIDLTWSIPGTSGNGITVVSSGSGLSTVNFAGGNTTITTENPTSATIDQESVKLIFTSNVFSTDKLSISEVFNTSLDESVNTGFDFSNAFSIDLVLGGQTGTNFTTGFTDYIEENNTFYKRTFRRDEIYSVGLSLLFNNGASTPAFHIPGNNKLDTTDGRIPHTFTDGGLLGTYRSLDLYPKDKGYPDDTNGYADNNIRHHWLPKVSDEPLFRVDGDNVFIRVIKLKFEFNTPIPQSLLDDVQEILFLRERRNEQSKKSIISQGITNHMGISGDFFNVRDGGKGNLVAGSAVNGYNPNYDLIQMPFFGYMNEMNVKSESSIRTNGMKGFVFPNSPALNSSDRFGNYNDGTLLDSDETLDNLMFISPEATFSFTNYLRDSDAEASVLEEIAYYEGDLKFTNFRSDKVRRKQDASIYENYALTDVFIDFKNYVENSSEIQHAIERASFISNNLYRGESLDSDNPPISTKWSQGGLLLKSTNDIPYDGSFNISRLVEVFRHKSNERTEYPTQYTSSNGETFGTRFGGENSAPTGDDVFPDARKTVYNIKRLLDRQYGSVDQAEYIIMERQSPFESNGDFRTTYSNIFGGDTFITKWSFMNGELVPYYPYTELKTEFLYSTSTDSGGTSGTFSYQRDGITYLNPNNQPNIQDPIVGKAYGWDHRWLGYMFVESDINTYYRHKETTNIEDGVKDYFPKNSDITDLLNSWFPWQGDVKDYNTTYSYENAIKLYYPIGSTNELINKFENRTIYSETSAEDDILDSYRSFLVNNYYDLPSNTGPIWDTFVYFDRLYMHTPKSLWKTFAEPAATLQGGNIDDVVLGTSNLFSRPSQEVQTTTGGFAGTISQFGGSHTQSGYVFPDILQGKIFSLRFSSGSPSLVDITLDGLYTFMHKNIGANVDLANISTSTAHLIDNPFNNIGVTSGYDYKLNRIMITSHDSNFTYSYNTSVNRWISEHDYHPNIYITIDNRVLLMSNDLTRLDELNIGPKGSYFDNVYDSKLTVISNKDNVYIKTYDNIEVWSKSTNNTNVIRDNTFRTINVYNELNNSGEHELIPNNSYDSVEPDGSVFYTYANDKYNISLPRDNVKDNSSDIFNPDNIYVPMGTVVRESIEDYDLERIKGDYAVVDLIYDNADNYKFVVKYILTKYRVNKR